MVAEVAHHVCCGPRRDAWFVVIFVVMLVNGFLYLLVGFAVSI